ncbi:MAG: hypothetical protein LBV63_04015 [Candidatus Methanoplasma sp.]|jgi:hypothetical protein|nr:hypothetical protein [Candidatus Methanoplasma sp.]
MLSYSKEERNNDILCLFAFPGGLLLFAILAKLGHSTADFGDTYVVGTEVISAIVVMILPILRLARKFRSPYWFVLLITSVAYVHAVSLYLGLYKTTDWWDYFSHVYSSMVVTLIVFIALMIIQKYTTRIELGKYPLLLMTFIIGYGFGNSWEAFEWAVDKFYGDHLMSYSIFDTLRDITLSDFTGALIMVVITHVLMSKMSIDQLTSGMNLDDYMTRTGAKWDRKCGDEEED